MANKKITITLSDEAVEKLQLQSKVLDLSINTYIKTIAMNHISNSKLIFFTPEQKIAIQEFSQKQSKLINTLNTISEQYLKKNQTFPISKVQEYLRSYHKIFNSTIQELQNDN